MALNISSPLPTVGGDLGTWGTELNTAITEIINEAGKDSDIVSLQSTKADKTNSVLNGTATGTAVTTTGEASKLLKTGTFGNIGIGVGATETSGYLEKIYNPSGASMIKFSNSSTGQTSSDGLDVGIDSSGSAEIRQRENSALKFYTNNSLALTIGNDASATFAGLVRVNTGAGDNLVLGTSGGAGIILVKTSAGVESIRIDGSTGIVKGQFQLSALSTPPASATATGTLGEIRVDANYIYVCVATNTWKRTALTTW